MAIKTRAEADQAFTWKLEDIYENDAAWEAELQRTKEMAAGYAAIYQGTLGSSPEALFAAMAANDDICLLLERLYVYAHMRRDEDNANPKYQGMTDRAMQLNVDFGARTAFMTPEILEIPGETLRAWAALPELTIYRHGLLHIDRQRAHVLTEGEEKLMALVSEPLQGADNIFTMLDSVDLRFGEVTDEKGETHELTHGSFRNYLESRDRSVRKNAFETFYASYQKLTNTYAAAYSSSVKGDVFFARARHYKGCLEAALAGGNVPVSVYEGLLTAVHQRLPAMGEYLALRKKALNVDTLHMYDLYVPMVPEIEMPMTYEEAQALVKEALAPLGERYQSLLDEAYRGRWIDVYENRGKTTGAFSWGCYGTHPYVLLNFQPNVDYAFTLAHELGHAMHTYFSDEAQAYPNAQYKIMAAEVASTVNEVLLLQHMLKRETEPARRAYLLNHFLEQFRTTVFRQTMFAEFEKIAHEMAQQGEPLTVESLSNVYRGLNEKYYQGVVVDEQIHIEWMRIPHFYNAFYVYQYATGFCAAVAIAKEILEGKGPGDYMRFLQSGGSDYPIELLKLAGVDLTKPESISSSLDVFEDSIAQLNELL